MFKKIALALGVSSVAALAIYTIKIHYDYQEILGAVNDLAENFIQHQTDIEFAEIVEGLDDIDE